MYRSHCKRLLKAALIMEKNLTKEYPDNSHIHLKHFNGLSQLYTEFRDCTFRHFAHSANRKGDTILIVGIRPFDVDSIPYTCWVTSIYLSADCNPGINRRSHDSDGGHIQGTAERSKGRNVSISPGIA